MIKIGIIGLSPGNGHPYSWSAIINGYDPILMENCGFPLIPKYLAQESFPDCRIKNAAVTHIFTEDFIQSQDIAASCFIKNVSHSLEDLVTSVDAVVLARDDAENHFSMSKLALERGIPIFIDKPLAYNRDEAERIFANETYEGQLFSCSGVRFSSIFPKKNEIEDEIGSIKSIRAESPKDWNKYSVHIIDPIISYYDKLDTLYEKSYTDNYGEITVTIKTVLTSIELTTTNKTSGAICFEFVGTRGTKKLVFNDTFFSFKQMLENFLLAVRERIRIIPKEETLKICEIISYAKN